MIFGNLIFCSFFKLTIYKGGTKTPLSFCLTPGCERSATLVLSMFSPFTSITFSFMNHLRVSGKTLLLLKYLTVSFLRTGAFSSNSSRYSSNVL